MRAVFIFIFLIFSLNSFGQNQNQVDRREFIKQIYARFASLVVESLKPYDGWTPVENYFIQHITAATKEYIFLKTASGGPQITVQFSNDQSLFTLDPNQPPRTAVIGNKLGDPIIFNLNVINQRDYPIKISQVVQLLFHEFGHFVPKERTDAEYLKARQAMIDSIAAKAAKKLEGVERHIQLSDGTIIRAMSASDVRFGILQRPTQIIIDRDN